MGQIVINPGTILVPGLNIQGDSDTGITGPAANTLGLVTGGVERARVGSAGAVYIGDNANGGMTLGLTINQGASDDEIAAYKSSDVAHGITDLVETDTYGAMAKADSAAGGLQATGLTSSIEALRYRAFYTTDSTTHSAAGDGAVYFNVAKKSVATVGAPGAEANIFLVAANASVKFIVDAEGDLFADGSTVTVYDEHDDVALARTLALVNARVGAKGLVKSRWDRFVATNERTLIDLDILGGPRVGVPPEKRGLINYTALARLHNGALWQLHEDMMEIAALLPLKARRRLPARIQAQLLAAA